MLFLFARNFRGFKEIDFELMPASFLVGDNSSGKTSIQHLVNYVLSTELEGIPQLDEDLHVDRHDFFSPYHPDEDVTIGFMTDELHEKFAKSITFSQRKNLPPKVNSAVFVIGNIAAVLRVNGRSVRALVCDLSDDWGISDVEAAGQRTRGFKKVKSNLFGLPVNSPIVASIAIKEQIPEHRDLSEIERVLFESTLPNCRHVGPLRAQPEKYYKFDRKYDALGMHFASMWHDIGPKIERNPVASKLLKAFALQSGLFTNLQVIPISRKMVGSPMLVTIERGGNKFVINQVGVGVSQVIPVIVETIFSIVQNNNIVFVLQQPELHLHPKAQAATGDYLFGVARAGTRLIAETHSDYLIDSFRAALRDSDQKVDTQILFCQNNDSGNSVESIIISETGKMISPPDAYHEFFLSELQRTMF